MRRIAVIAALALIFLVAGGAAADTLDVHLVSQTIEHDHAGLDTTGRVRLPVLPGLRHDRYRLFVGVAHQQRERVNGDGSRRDTTFTRCR